MRILSAAILCAVAGAALAQQRSQQQPNPCDSKFRVVGDITYCDRYWECIGNEPHLFDCPNGLVFVGRNRGIADGCDYPWRGPYCVDKELANPPISTAHCGWLYGIFGHETSCTRYWTCWNGTSTEQFCIGGLLYSEDTHACDWPQNVAGCQKHPLCKDDPNANVPLGQSCERYWACQGGYPRLQRCPATLVFNKLSRRCVNPPTDDCEAPLIIQDPEQEENKFRQTVPASPRPQRRRPTSQRGELAQDEAQFVPDNTLPSRSTGPRPLPSLPQSNNLRPAPIAGAIPLN
ncbi:protein obstructor-E-like isoform X1 [Panulirus ornatus]|uniref:protein obstructor-E-like isoform X1 n=1 Tax=Panulirus ornatus TaxID=150431 RepID=UPI003A83560F